MSLPKQCIPVTRPHFVAPSTCVDIKHIFGPTASDRYVLADILGILQDLKFGANYNDPAAFAYRGYNQVMHSGRGCFSSMGRFL